MDDLAASVEERSSPRRAHARADVETIGQLGAQIAHDFNNVLAVVLTSIEMAMRVSDTAKAQGFLLNAIKTINRGRGMTERLAEAARACGETERIDVHALLAEIERGLGCVPGVRVVVRADAAHSVVRADRLFLERALHHLVANAIEAMPHGGTLTIATSNAHGLELRAAETDECLVLAVADTGAGMPPDVRARAFELFFGTHGEDARRGVGLAQAKDAARRAGGFAAIESEEGHGTTVSLAIPLDRSDGS